MRLSGVRFLLLLPLLSVINAPAAVPSSQGAALRQIYAAAGGPGWTARTNWLSDSISECQWDGIACDATGSTVVAIHLSSNNLVG